MNMIWNREETRLFIALYRECPCLYDPRNSQYTNKIKRSACLAKIQSQMAIYKPNISVKDIKAKLKTLQVQLYKERKRIESSKRSGCGTDETIRVPSLWCYNELSFLSHCNDTVPSYSNITCNMNWTREETKQLITLYRESPCLYDPSNVNFTNKIQRSACLANIQSQMAVYKPNITVRDIKTKIKTLQTQLYKEKKRIASSKRSDSGTDDVVRPPALWCYNDLLFLSLCNDTIPSYSNIKFAQDVDPLSSEEVLSNEVCSEELAPDKPNTSKKQKTAVTCCSRLKLDPDMVEEGTPATLTRYSPSSAFASSAKGKYAAWQDTEMLLHLQSFTPLILLIDFIEKTRTKRFYEPSERYEILMLMFIMRKRAPFCENKRFPEEYWVNLSVGSMAEALDRLQSAIDIPDLQLPINMSATDFTHWKELFDASMAEIRSFSHYTDEKLLADVGVFKRKTFEERFGLQWQE